MTVEATVWAVAVVMVSLSVDLNYNSRKEVSIMPRADGTGPMGNGPRTGRGAGPCAGNLRPDNMNQMPGRGFGRGSGRGLGGGMGRGRWARKGGFCVQPNPEEEQYSLENQKVALQGRLNDVNKKLDELKTQET